MRRLIWLFLIIPLLLVSDYRTDPRAGRNATLVVAASNSSDLGKSQADYECNGTADEVEIQAAITALPSGGGTVKLLEGTYTMGDSVTIPNNVSIVGSGRGTLVNFDVTQDKGFVNSDQTSGNHSITISDMKIDGMDKTNDPIELVESYNCQLQNLEVTRGAHDGIELSKCYYCTINNVIAHDSKTYCGIELDDSSYYNVVSNCVAYDNNAGEITVGGESCYNLITGCIADGSIRFSADTHDNTAFGNIASNGYVDTGAENLIVSLKDGNIGIGKFSPYYKLDIQDSTATIRWADFSNSLGILGRTGTGQGFLQLYDGASVGVLMRGQAQILVAANNDTTEIKQNFLRSDSVNINHLAVNTNATFGAGTVLVKIVKVGSHLAIILTANDTLWAAADTTNF